MFSNGAIMHQKQPPAKVAVWIFADPVSVLIAKDSLWFNVWKPEIIAIAMISRQTGILGFSFTISSFSGLKYW
jgi:hypothetical protein